jgi:hypothetical protein
VLRVTSDANENLRVSPATGALVAGDTLLTPTTANVVGIAYDRNVRGATQTTLYSYDLSNNQLVTIGSVNGSPKSPNSGNVSVVGPSTVTADSGTAGRAGFDVGDDGVGYLNLVVNGTSGLYTANLGTGNLSLVGNIGGVTLVGLSEAPATALTVTGFLSPVMKNTPGTFTVTAVDPYGVTVPGYSGTVTFTSTDRKVTLPADPPLTNGTGQFTASFATVGTQSLTASDTAAPTITGTQSGIVVTAPGTPPKGVSRIGVVRGAPDRVATLSLDTNGDGTFDSGDSVLNFGLATDRFLVGRWRQPSQLVAADGALDAAAPPLALDANFLAVANQAIAAWQQAGGPAARRAAPEHPLHGGAAGQRGAGREPRQRHHARPDGGGPRLVGNADAAARQDGPVHGAGARDGPHAGSWRGDDRPAE